MLAFLPPDADYDESEIRRIFNPICESGIHEVVPIYDLNGDLLRLKDISEIDIRIMQMVSENDLA